MIDLWNIGEAFNRHSGAEPTLDNCLRRTQIELIEALIAPSAQDQLIEIADIILTLASGCQAAGLDLDAAISYKHAINMERQWEPHPEIPGTVRHKKETK